jgi:predicted ATPase/class 3 adenylate cyclase
MAMDEAGPTGIVTCLFTDIEGSTQRWEREPARMAQAVARHDELLRRLVAAHGGHVVKSTGDGVYAIFADAAGSVGAVVDIQLALSDPGVTAGMPIAVRCGLHRGVAEQRDNDYFGSTINRAARVMGAAHGGQILVSQSVVDAVKGALPAAIAFRDLGSVRLKGFATAEHVYQVLDPRLRADFPALRALEATPNNLPFELTSFIGRTSELVQAGALLRKARLLTLVGMGGFGKTRLALRLGADALVEFPDGVWLVDLAPIRDPLLVLRETATVLGLREEAGTPLLATIANHVKSRTLLLILDNCEHLLGASADLAALLLRGAAGVRIVATSREALRVPGEQIYPVMPLPVPADDEAAGTVADSPAVRLFVDRAQQHKPAFELGERESPAVAEIVARLEGIPLAIELAAARVRSMSVNEINARLEDRYKLLTGGGRCQLERQQTLRALVDWSYDLLREDEQILFGRLSVFAGGFDLAAIESICSADPLSPEAIADLVSSLVDKSLVMAGEGDERDRYRMLETIRQYARIRQMERGELDGTSARHCNHFFLMAKAASTGIQGPAQADWLRRLESEHDNLRSAIAYCLAGHGDPFVAGKMEVALQGFRTMRGYATEGRNNVRVLLSLPAIQESGIGSAHMLYVGGVLANELGDTTEAERMLEACLALRRSLGEKADAAGTAGTVSTLAAVRLRRGDSDRARVGELEALAMFRRIGDPIGEAIALLHLAEIGAHRGDEAEALRFVADSLAIARRIGHQELESDCEKVLGELALERPDLNAARHHFRRALEICERAQDRRGSAIALSRLGHVDLGCGETAAAQQRLDGALLTLRSFQGAETIGCLEDHALLAHSTGDVERAVRLDAAAAEARERMSLPRSPRAAARWAGELASLRERLGDAAFAAVWDEGRRLSLDDAIRFATDQSARTG